MPAPTIDTKAMLVKLSISQWTGRKEDKTITEEVEQNHNAHDAGKYHKYTIDKEFLKKKQKNINEARTYHYRVTLPYTVDGLDILPSALYFDYTQQMKKFKTTDEENTRDILDNYQTEIERSKKRLSGMFNPADYPTVEQLKRKFDFTFKFYPIATAKTWIVDLNKEEMDRLKEETEKEIKSTQDNAIKDIWKRLQETVARMAERLSDPDATFKNTLVSNVADLCRILPRLNFTDDPELEKTRADVENKLTKFTPETLREDQDARKETARAAREILETIIPRTNDAPPTPPALAAADTGDAAAKLSALETMF